MQSYPAESLLLTTNKRITRSGNVDVSSSSIFIQGRREIETDDFINHESSAGTKIETFMCSIAKGVFI
jgi:hypothetical protein